MSDRKLASLATFIFGFLLSAVLTADGILPIAESGAGWSLFPIGVITLHLVYTAE